MRDALEVHRTGDEYSHRRYHVHYWRTASGSRVLDDVEMEGNENLQSAAIYDVDRHNNNKHHHRRCCCRQLPMAVVIALPFVFVSAIAAVGLVGSGANKGENGEPPHFAVRLSAGAEGAHTDSNGAVWIPDIDNDNNNDLFSIHGRSTTHEFDSNVTIDNAGLVGQEIYRSERYFINNGEQDVVGYEIPVPSSEGTYDVNLHFAELWFDGVGERVMDVYVEGELLKSDFDIVRDAGGANLTAVVLSCQRTVYDGALTVQLVSIVENAKINGIEVIRV